MRKILVQGLFLVTLFFSSWLLLNQINWISILRIQKITQKTEEKLGDLFWEVFKKTEKENKNKFVNSAIDSLVSKICAENNIDETSIKIHILDNSDINAFALPNNHLVLYSGLIEATESQEELCGVICHEIAHMELNHVMKKLVKEVGLSMLISMTTGNSSAESVKGTVKLLSSSAFDRNLEKEADLKAIEYLINAKINPEPLANFLYKLSENENSKMKYLIWISTHPDSKERAEYIIENIKNDTILNESILTIDSWNKIKEILAIIPAHNTRS